MKDTSQFSFMLTVIPRLPTLRKLGMLQIVRTILSKENSIPYSKTSFDLIIRLKLFCFSHSLSMSNENYSLCVKQALLCWGCLGLDDKKDMIWGIYPIYGVLQIFPSCSIVFIYGMIPELEQNIWSSITAAKGRWLNKSLNSVQRSWVNFVAHSS